MFDWNNTGSWPYDALDHIFLGNALMAFGKVLFGEQWTGRELRANIFVSGPLPDTADEAKYSQQSRASRLLLLHRPDLVPGGLESIEGNTNRPPQIIFTDEQWRAAVDVAAEQSKASAGEIARAQGARLAVREHAAFGRLPTFAQGDDGDFHQIKQIRWNTPRFEKWLTGCKISPVDTYGGFTTDVGLRLWIFVGKDELSALTTATSATLPDADQKTGPLAFKKAFRAIVEASPDHPVVSKKELAQMASKFDISGRQAGSIRLKVLEEEFPALVSKIWKAPGRRPKK
ncbi:MAG: hypothetical protein EOS08_13405 [Mesorhizobium sp.]|nr:MAG: hypothetical protein EOS08_13405 [Mesorhizobium sp.]